MDISVPSSILGTPDIAQRYNLHLYNNKMSATTYTISVCTWFILILTYSNILSLRLRSLHSLPDAWQPGTFPHTFTLSLPLPFSDADSTPAAVTVPQGTLKLGPDKDPSCVATHWKWPGSGGGQVTSSKIENHALENETGELNTKQVS